MESTNEVRDLGEIIDSGNARREAEQLAKRGGVSAEERYEDAVAEAAGVVASTLEATGTAPLDSVAVDGIFRAAGFTPDSETRMAAVRLGRRIYAERQDARGKAEREGEASAASARRSAAYIAKADLERITGDPTCDLTAIFAGVIAHRKATGVPGPVDGITFESAVELATQKRSVLP